MSLTDLTAPNPASLRDLTTKAPAREIVRGFLHRFLAGTIAALDVVTAAAAAASAAAAVADGKAVTGQAQALAAKVRAETGLISVGIEGSLTSDLAELVYRANMGALNAPAIQAATQNGRLKLNAPLPYRWQGQVLNKNTTDDLWDVSGLGALNGTQYRAAFLYLDGTGTASVAAGSIQANENAATGALPAVDTAKALIATIVGQPNCNFANALNIPAGVKVINGFVAPLAVKSSIPAALFGQGANGKIQTKGDAEFRIGGRRYRKAATVDLFDLSALGTTGVGVYKAVYLYLSTAGAASVVAGTGAASSAAAIAALPAVDVTKAPIGVYVMNPSGNFANALDAQGTYLEGWAATAF